MTRPFFGFFAERQIPLDKLIDRMRDEAISVKTVPLDSTNLFQHVGEGENVMQYILRQIDRTTKPLLATVTKLQERVEELERQMYDITGIIQNITVRR